MAEKDEVMAAVRATLLSYQGALSLVDCDRDFRQIQGYNIPYKKLGFSTLHELFESDPRFKITPGGNGEKMITVTPSLETRHIANMVAKQRSSKKPINRAPPPRKLKLSPRSFSHNNNNNSSGYYKSQPSPNTRYNRYNSTETYIEPRPPRSVPQPLLNIKVPETFVKSPKNDMIIRNPKSETNPKSPKSITPVKIIMTERTVKTQNGKPLKIVVNPAMANSNTSCNSKAANRMSTLQKKIQEESALEYTKVQEKINNINKELSKLNFDDGFKENKARLLRYCELKKIPIPEFKTCEIPRKGRTKTSSYDCSLKIQNETFNTYPNSESTMELAIEKVCFEALKSLCKKDQEKPSTSKDIALQRLLELINCSPNGFIAKKLPEFYLDKYQEKLPDDWLELLQSSRSVKFEKGVNELTIILPNDDRDNEVIEISSTSSSTSSVNELFYPPSLQYPADLQWNVFVMSATSTVEIWIRIIGEEYSDAFESLNTDMELHYLDEFKPARRIINDAWYALKCNDGWLRSRILNIDSHNKTALCFLPDTGDEENHSFNSFYDLPNKFLVLPPQAILCQLSGLEQFSVDDICNAQILSDMLVGKVLIAEVCEIPYDTEDEDPVTIVLYDTSTDQDINLNTVLIQQMSQEVKPPQLSTGISNIFICNVQADGTIYAQIRNEKWNQLEKMIQKAVNSPLLKEAYQASIGPVDLMPNVRYLIKSSSGNWLRGVLKYNSKSLMYSDKDLMATYIDYGYSERVSIKDVIRLDRISSVLNSFPVQVLKLSLHNVPPLNNEHLQYLNKIIPPETSVLCRRVTSDTNAVEIFIRIPPLNLPWNVNDAINMEIELSKNSSKNITSNVLSNKEGYAPTPYNYKKSSPDSNYMPVYGLPPSTMPERKSHFDVFVLMAANPSNFMVQSLIHRDGFNALMLEVQNHSMSPIATKPTVGCVYLAYHEKDVKWRRIIVQSLMSHNMASVYFCDSGYLEMIETNKLRELPAELKRIPAQAIRAKLYGVSPINADWSVEDCMRFKEIVVNKKFKTIVENIEQDPLQKNEALLTLNLIDASNSTICISDLLLRESRARKSN